MVGEVVVGSILTAAFLLIFLKPKGNVLLSIHLPQSQFFMILFVALSALSVVTAVYFFKKNRVFIFLYIAQAAANTLTAVFLILASSLSLSSLSLASLAWDVIFIAYFFNSKRVAATFGLRKLEFVEKDYVDLDAGHFSGHKFVIGMVVLIAAVVATSIISNYTVHLNGSTSARLTRQQLDQMIRSQSPGIASAPRPSAHSGGNASPAPVPTANPKYDVLRMDVSPPTGGEPFDPLKLLDAPSCLGENINVIIQNLRPVDYTAGGSYVFRPNFDYLGLGWETNQVRMDIYKDRVSNLTYITESLDPTKQSGFLKAATQKYNALVKKYGNPMSSTFINPSEQKSTQEPFEAMIRTLETGVRGNCSFIWNAPGMKITLSFSNAWQNPKNGHLEVIFQTAD